MSRLKSLLHRFMVVLTVVWLTHPAGAWACSACYGKSDSAMARGLNWGIFSLLAVVGVVLSAFASFFVYLGRRSGVESETADSGQSVSSNKT